MLEMLLKVGIGLREIEEFILHEEKKLKGGGVINSRIQTFLKTRGMVKFMMKRKLKDEG